VRIHCTTTFLDGVTRFEKDDICTVSDEDGARFVENGWATAHGEADQPSDAQQHTTLAIHNVTQRTTTEVSNG
jgi:hypothetical protein